MPFCQVLSFSLFNTLTPSQTRQGDGGGDGDDDGDYDYDYDYEYDYDGGGGGGSDGDGGAALISFSQPSAKLYGLCLLSFVCWHCSL